MSVGKLSAKAPLIQIHYHARDINIQDRDVMFSASLFPEGRDGDAVEIAPDGDPKRGVVLTGYRFEKKKELHQSAVQLTILEPVAKCLHIGNRSSVSVRVVDLNAVPEALELEFVELTFREYFLSRSDVWRVCGVLRRRAVYVGQQLEGPDRMRVTVQGLVSRRREKVVSGVITPATKIMFRSKSATIYWLWQISAEMWHYTEYGELYFDLAVNSLVHHFGQRWEGADSTHSIAVLFFARVLYPDSSHEDFYKVVKMLNERKDYESTRMKLKTHFATFLESIGCSDPLQEGADARAALGCDQCGLARRDEVERAMRTPLLSTFGDRSSPSQSAAEWPAGRSDAATGPAPASPALSSPLASPGNDAADSLPPSLGPGRRSADREGSASPVSSETDAPSGAPSSRASTSSAMRRGRIAPASEGNLLEAINLALNALEAHFVDRNLSHAGQAISLVTAANGCWRASPALARLTRQRVLRTGMPCDVVCLGPPPMHTVPLLELTGRELAAVYEEDFGFVPDNLYFEYPDWLSLHYYSKAKHGYVLRTVASRGPLAHCRELPPQPPPLPVVPPRRPSMPTPPTEYTADRSRYNQAYFDAHDRSVFERPDTPRTEPIFSLRRTVHGLRVAEAAVAVDDARNARRRLRQLPSELVSLFAEPSEGAPASGRRWAHQRSHDFLAAGQGEEALDNYGFLLEPALLPITTDEWPQVDLKGAQQHNYDVAPGFGQYGTTLGYLLREAVMQRLHRGYQLVQRAEPRESGSVERYWLWNGSQVQILSLDEGDVCIKVERRTLPEAAPRSTGSREAVAGYRFQNYNNILEGWQTREVRFGAPGDVVWNKLDVAVAGTLDTAQLLRPEAAAMQFRRIRMVMVTPPGRQPPAAPPDPQKRIAAFQKVLQEFPHRQKGWKLGDGAEVQVAVSDAAVRCDVGDAPALPPSSSPASPFALHAALPPLLSLAGPGSPLAPPDARTSPGRNPPSGSHPSGGLPLPSALHHTAVPWPPLGKVRLEIEKDHDRPFQWLDVHYSKAFNPRCSFAWEIAWTSCSATLVAEAIDKLQRRATSNGFAMYLVPCSSTPYAEHPFRSYAAVDIPRSPIQDLMGAITRQLLEPPFQFIPDSAAVTRGSLLIDPAGDVLVRLTDAGFVWFNNYANFTGSITIGQGHAELKKKFADFEGLCAAYVTADAVLTQIVDALPSEPAPLTQTAESPSARKLHRNSSLLNLVKRTIVGDA